MTDLEWLKSLVQLMNQNELVELVVEENGRKVRLKKQGAVEPRAVRVEKEAPAAPAAPAAAPPGEKKASARPENVVEVPSPMVGTFYRASSPEAAPFVEVGSAVKEDTTLCIIEAMKVMNEIKAEMEGVVEEILISNGEAVEYGQPLFLVKKTR